MRITTRLRFLLLSAAIPRASTANELPVNLVGRRKHTPRRPGRLYSWLDLKVFSFVALHGSWNRSKPSGYKISFIPFENGEPLAGPEDFMTGWLLSADEPRAWGRPVGLLQMPDGSMLVSDDGDGRIWRVSYVGSAHQTERIVR